MPTFTTLVTFNSDNGAHPTQGLIIDAAGNLIGTSYAGGSTVGTQLGVASGTVFEIAKTANGYASTTTLLASFSGTNGSGPVGGLTVDAAGNLFGTAMAGGANDKGIVWKIAKTGFGYAPITTLVTFDGANGVGPESLTVDADGNLFGSTLAVLYSLHPGGTLFEVPKTAIGYASAPTTLTSFVEGGGMPLVVDSTGNLFGAWPSSSHLGQVFELPKVGASYASTLTSLFDFSRTTGGIGPQNLMIDSAGNIFGTTGDGGTVGGATGTIFEIPKTASGYASAPITLANFTAANGITPTGALLMDAAGSLFGVTQTGGAYNQGTVFELLKTASGYASTVVTLFSFSDTNTPIPNGRLVADAAGNLFGETIYGGANNLGTVFELSGTGFQTSATVSGAAASAQPLSGTAGTTGNDVFSVSASNATINGGGGHDTVMFTSAAAQETIAKNADGTITVTDSSGIGHVLANIEYLQFVDKTVFVEGSDNANVARLYSAAFNRQPDSAGLNFWEDLYANGVSSSVKTSDSTAVLGLAGTVPAGASASIAQSFIASAEFQGRYGALTDAAFITQLYANVLGRLPDSSGLNYWEGVLVAGGSAARAAVLVNFADGGENLGKVDFAQHPSTGWLFSV